MNAISKRLFSWLIVAAMVLSMVPALNLSNYAIETNAAAGTTAIDIDNSDSAIEQYVETESCPMCGAAAGEAKWATYSGNIGSYLGQKDVTLHIVYEGDVSVDGNFLQVASGSSNINICIAVKKAANIKMGGRIQFSGDNTPVLNIMGTGTITADPGSFGKSSDYGLFQIGQATVNLYGGTYRHVSLGTDIAMATIRLADSTSYCNIYDEAIIGAASCDKTKMDRNVHMAAGTLTMFGGEIRNGSFPGSASRGGNIYMQGRTTFNMYGGKVYGGYAGQRGGNMYLNYDSYAKVNISGGEMYGGIAGAHGGNIYAYLNKSASDSTAAYLNVTDGKIYGGTATLGANIYIPDNTTVTVSGGTIVGGIYAQQASSKLVLKNNAKILKTDGTVTATEGLVLNGADTKLTIDELGTGAEIWVSGAVGKVVTNTSSNAANVVNCFKSFDDHAFEVQDNALVIVEKPATPGSGAVEGVFDPEGNDGWAYCPACKAQGKTALVKWTEYDGANNNYANRLTEAGHYHFYLTAGKTYVQNFLRAENVTVCFNLNGQTVEGQSDSGSAFYVKNTFFLMDTKGGGQIIANNNSNDGGAAVQVNGGSTCYIYGGTYKNVGTGPVVKLDSDGSNTLYLYDGAVIDGNNTARGIYLAGVNNIVNMEGGVIKNGKATDHGGNVWAYRGTFNMNGGTIQDGTAPNRGGNIYLHYGQNAKVNINGGKIFGGNAKEGGNIYAYSTNADAKLTITAGEIYDGTATTDGGNIYLGDGSSKMVLSGGEIYNGSAVRGGNIYQANGANMTISGGIIVGDYYFHAGALTLTGAPQIVASNTKAEAKQYGLQFGTVSTSPKMNIEGLTSDARICVSVASGDFGKVLSTAAANAADLLANDVFSTYEDYTVVEVKEDNTIVVYRAPNAASVVTGDGTVYYGNVQDAVDAYDRDNGDKYVCAYGGGTVDIGNKIVYINNSGKDMIVNGTGTLYAIDSDNDNFDGFGKWTVDDEIDVKNDVTHPTNSRRYIVIKNADGTYSAHYVEITLTHVTLRTGPKAGDYSAPGLYYKAEYKCDADLAERITSYGVALSTDSAPEDDLLRNDVRFSALENFKTAYDEDTKAVAGTSCMLYNILKVGENNNSRIDLDVYANAYLRVNVDGTEDLSDDVVFADTTGAVNSMLDVLKTVDTKWTDYSTEQQDLVKAFYSYWKNNGGLNLDEQLTNIA